MSKYLDNLELELRSEGVEPINSNNCGVSQFVDDIDLKTILEMERITGVKYSDEQKEILKYRGNECIIACAGSGKALVNDTKVLTDHGYIRISDIKFGDKVYDCYGREQFVIGYFPQGKKRVYIVTLNDGSKIKCCSDHLWTCVNRDGKFEVKNTREWKRVMDESVDDVHENCDNVKGINKPKLKFMSLPNYDKVSDCEYIRHNGDFSKVVDKIIPDTKEILRLIKKEIKYDEIIKADNKNNLMGILMKKWRTLENVGPEFIEKDKIDFLSQYIVFMSDDLEWRIVGEELRNIIVSAYEIFGWAAKVESVKINNSNSVISEYFIITPLKERYIESIEETDELKYMTCIKVTGETETFLLRRCIPTHNTTINTHLIAKRVKTGEIKDTNKVIYTTHSRAGKDEMKDRLDKLFEQLGIRQRVDVRTLHSFFLSLMSTFGVIKPEEYSRRILSDDSTRIKLINEACKDAQYIPRDDDISIINNLLSYQVNNLLSDEGTVGSCVNTLDDLDLETYRNIRSGYARKKSEKQLIDYDDMQSYLYLWLVKYAKSNNTAEYDLYRQIRDYCQAMWTDFYIDEAQDVSKIQFEIIKAMIVDPDKPDKLKGNLVFIGDDDQCIIEGTPISVRGGYKNIEDITEDDILESACGNGMTTEAGIDNVSKRYVENEDIVVIKTKSGKIIKGTDNHIGFARIDVKEGLFFVYIAYRHGVGFKVDCTSGLFQETRSISGECLKKDKAERLWVLKICDSLEDANYWKYYYSYEYLVPVVGFEPNGRLKRAYESTEMLIKLHRDLKSYEHGMELLDDFGYSFDYPHDVMKTENVSGDGDEGSDTYRVSVNIFGSRLNSSTGIYKSNLSVSTDRSHKKFSEIMKLMLNWECALYNGDYLNGRQHLNSVDSIMDKLKCFVEECSNNGLYVEKDINIRLTKKNFRFMNFGNMIEGTTVAVRKGDMIVEDEIVSVSREKYTGYVYDISVPKTRNFIAGDMVVHNCIYQWRGSDPSIILSIPAMFDMKTFVLSTNYRCKGKIVDFASGGIERNEARYKKSMKSSTDGGNVKILNLEGQDLYTMSVRAMDIIKGWINDGCRERDIAVLSRNNAHLSILGSLLLHDGVYSDINNDMKITKSYMYKDIKTLVDLSDISTNSNLTKAILWKLCRYMSRNAANVVADLQSSGGLSFEQVIGFTLYKYLKPNDLSINYSDEIKNIKVPEQVNKRVSYYMARIGNDTINDMAELYVGLREKSRFKRLKVMMERYMSSTSYLYKSQDKSRSIGGMITYIANLIYKDGFDKTLEFLRVSEQFESGKMAVIGDKITLSTIHGAKGREWKNVIMFACDNIAEPDFNAIYKMVDRGLDINDIYRYIDEERRICYVGNTRAKENLIIISSSIPSVFILEALGMKCSNDRIMEYIKDLNILKMDSSEIVESKLLDRDSDFRYNG